ncbi:Hypothetical_protein [Hexamita inflata]|uniref:Hypothetical_protein n=1 Tax=Hexamita inflata TaxID=28002 RepID=A0AA86RF27_9EUKA|nr:Hypothetical protein HINF_LOCUS64427 [Hexamita inflata]CAI9976786.1 Hypothetical protein HINF_LOCUS64431 [Hexamita inflata]
MEVGQIDWRDRDANPKAAPNTIVRAIAEYSYCSRIHTTYLFGIPVVRLEDGQAALNYATIKLSDRVFIKCTAGYDVYLVNRSFGREYIIYYTEYKIQYIISTFI